MNTKNINFQSSRSSPEITENFIRLPGQKEAQVKRLQLLAKVIFSSPQNLKIRGGYEEVLQLPWGRVGLHEEDHWQNTIQSHMAASAHLVDHKKSPDCGLHFRIQVSLAQRFPKEREIRHATYRQTEAEELTVHQFLRSSIFIPSDIQYEFVCLLGKFCD